MGIFIAVILLIGAFALSKFFKAQGSDKIEEYSRNQDSSSFNFDGAISDIRKHYPDFASEAIRGIEKLKMLLMPDEDLVSTGHGTDDMKQVVYAVTNKRFLFCSIGIGKEQVTSLNYSKITNVDIIQKINTLNYVKVETGEKSIELLIAEKQRAVELFNSIQFQL